jgi:hypothetical protein
MGAIGVFHPRECCTRRDLLSSDKRSNKTLRRSAGVSRLEMRYDGSHLLLALLVLLTAPWGALSRSTEDVVIAYIEGDRTAVIVFLPPSMQDPQGRGAAEVQEHVRSAIEKSG